ncbi:MAG: Ldh family oxidoreductase [Phycisphaeraceae bacterium]
MKQPTASAVRVSYDDLYTFAREALQRVDVPEDSAALVARLLATNDLRGGLSHGTQQIPRYVHEIQTGTVNPQPNVRIVNETANSLLIDGDGGLGYGPFHDGTQRAIEKAKAQGMAMVVTRHHGHIGAAGIYPRLAAAADLCAFATSGVQLTLKPGENVYQAAGASPMSFAAPAGDERPLVLDCGVMHGLHPSRPRRNLEKHVPSIILRLIGFGTICQAWGGLLTGLPVDVGDTTPRWPRAHQGALLFVFDPGLFIDRDQFKREMDDYARRVRQLRPVPGTEGAYLPGAIEIEREQTYRRDGVPLSDRHQRQLHDVAQALGFTLPWQ